MAKCEICGKSALFGNNVPHSHHKTRRLWQPNIRTVTLTENGHPRQMRICTSCLRTRNKSRGS